ncbi:MAG: TolC family protein [Candidatus Celaenobacter antarcticus]|nr:TolC family protein [Candidatus Celaenobacter antarcticus]
MKKGAVLTIILLLFSASLYALDLTLELAKELALKNYPGYLSQIEALKSAQSGRWNAYASLLPSASLNVSQTRYNPDQTVGVNKADKLNTYGFSITQPIFNGGKIWLGACMQEDVVKISKENLRMAKLETLAGVETQYFSVLLNQQLMKIAELNLESSKTNLEIAQAKYDAGLLSKGEYLQIQAEKTNKTVSVLQIKNLYQTNKMTLLNYLQIGSIGTIEPVDSTDYSELLQRLQNLSIAQIDSISNSFVQYGLEHSPAIAMSNIAINTSKKSLLMAGGNFLPSVNLSFSKNWIKYDFMNDYDNSESITISASLPIFPIIDNVTSFTQAHHNMKKTQYDYQYTEDAVVTGIKGQFLNLVSYTNSIVASRASRAQAGETYAQMQEYFAQGMISANDLNSAQTLYLSTQNQYVQSLYDFLGARSALLQQLGTEKNIIIKIIEKNI